MRTIALLVFSTLIPASALAWESTTENVEFEGRTKMFRGVEYSAMLPSADSAIGLTFTADTEGLLTTGMKADSTVEWPEALTHSWEGITRGGTLQLDIKTLLAAAVHIDVWGYTFDVPLWEREFNWGGTSKFDDMLLEGGQATAIVQVAAEELFGLDYSFDITEDVTVIIGGDIYPAAEVAVTGIDISTNGSDIAQRDATAMLDLPAQHNGKVQLESTWKGNATGWFGIELVPWLDVCIDGMGCLSVATFTYPWELGEDNHDFASEITVFEHSLPALIPGTATLDLGVVTVGEEVTVDVAMRNLGQVELQGEATYTGDAVFELIDDDFYATMSAPGVLTVSFSPDQEGTFTGVLTITSNDPVSPSIQIPVIGTAEPMPVEDPGANDDLLDPNDDMGAARGCGCNSTPSGAPLGVFGLGLLGMLLRRRRNS